MIFFQVEIFEGIEGKILNYSNEKDPDFIVLEVEDGYINVYNSLENVKHKEVKKVNKVKKEVENFLIPIVNIIVSIFDFYCFYFCINNKKSIKEV